MPVFYTDCFDVGKPHDKTMNEIVKVLSLAGENTNYSLENMRFKACNKTKLSELINKQVSIIESLDNEEFQKYKKATDDIL